MSTLPFHPVTVSCQGDLPAHANSCTSKFFLSIPSHNKQAKGGTHKISGNSTGERGEVPVSPKGDHDDIMFSNGVGTLGHTEISGTLYPSHASLRYEPQFPHYWKTGQGNVFVRLGKTHIFLSRPLFQACALHAFPQFFTLPFIQLCLCIKG